MFNKPEETSSLTGDIPVSFNTKLNSKVPDGGWGWFVVLGSFLVHLLSDGIVYGFGIFTAEIVDFYDTNRQTIGWLNSILIGLSFVVGPIVSKLCDIFGFRTVAMGGGIFGCIGLAAVFVSSNFVFFFFMVTVVAGFGLGAVYLPSICIVSQYFENRRALAIGMAVCGSGIGTFMYGPLIAFLLEEFTWRGAMLIISGSFLNCCVCAAVYRPLTSKNYSVNYSNMNSFQESIYQLHSEQLDLLQSSTSRSIKYQSVRNDFGFTSSQSKNKGKSDPLKNQPAYNLCSFSNQILAHSFSFLMCRQENNSHNQFTNKSNKKSFSICNAFGKVLTDLFNPYLLKDPIFIIFAVSNILTSLGFNAPFLFAVDRATLGGISPKQASFLISSLGIGNTLGRIIFGALAMRGNKQFRLHLYNSSLVFCGISLIASCLATTFSWMIVYTFVFGLLSGTYVTLTPVVLVDLLGLECLNDSFGLTLLCMGIAVLIGPPLAGFIFDVTNSYNISFSACGLFILLSGVIMYPVFCLRKKNQETWK